jgi:hypothetical protein
MIRYRSAFCRAAGMLPFEIRLSSYLSVTPPPFG